MHMRKKEEEKLTITAEQRTNVQRYLHYLVFKTLDLSSNANKLDKVEALLQSSNITTTLAVAVLNDDDLLLEQIIKETSASFNELLEQRLQLETIQEDE